MNIGPKTLAAIIVVGATLVPVVGPIAWATLATGYPVRDRDWNQDGETTVAEFLAAADVGSLRIKRGGQTCIEYFSFKDGLPVRIVCP